MSEMNNAREPGQGRLDDDILSVYRLMPSKEMEHLLGHIDWMENELKQAKIGQHNARVALERANRLLSQKEKRSRKKISGIR